MVGVEDRNGDARWRLKVAMAVGVRGWEVASAGLEIGALLSSFSAPYSTRVGPVGVVAPRGKTEVSGCTLDGRATVLVAGRSIGLLGKPPGGCTLLCGCTLY